MEDVLVLFGVVELRRHIGPNVTIMSILLQVGMYLYHDSAKFEEMNSYKEGRRRPGNFTAWNIDPTLPTDPTTRMMMMRRANQTVCDCSPTSEPT